MSEVKSRGFGDEKGFSRYPNTLIGLARNRLTERGSILIISLWAVFLLTFFTVTLSSVIMRKLDLSNRVDAGLKFYFAAKAGIETAKAFLHDNKLEDHGESYSKWVSDESVF